MFCFTIFVSILIATSFAAEEAASSVTPLDPTTPCSRRNLYAKVEGQCDAYVECIDFVPVQKSCPDGLHYDVSVPWPNYPCGYPTDVPCTDRAVAQAAKPTSDCPHQYGYYPSPSAHPTDCGQYRMCIAGLAVDMLCPTGLAFNFETSRCDWPFLVKTCDVATYLGYQCPPASFDESGNPIVTNHKYDSNCFAFYSCQEGRGRLLSCDPGLAFDPISSHCVDADRVPCGTEVAVPQSSETASTL